MKLNFSGGESEEQSKLCKDGNLLISNEEVVGQWKEHFEELLNPMTSDASSLCDIYGQDLQTVLETAAGPPGVSG